MAPRTVDDLREAFLGFFADRGHSRVPSASLIPHDKSVLFTVAGMVPFKPYFTGEEPAPYQRATSSQKCVRAGGKHNDLDDIGRTNRHFSFFEMLGNFSFGNYFKEEAITFAWDFVTNVMELPVDRLWVTIHETDDEAEMLWKQIATTLPAGRIQRLGDDNWWKMGDIGPNGPSSEIFWDLGPEFGPDGGPATDSDRYIEFWNLVFMQFEDFLDADGVKQTRPLPKPSVDTGAGLERMLFVLQGKDDIWSTDLFLPLIVAAEQLTGVQYRNGDGGEDDVSLRIMAEHARTMTFLVSDGVRPSNQERGYVLRRIIRRAVNHAYKLGAKELVTPALVAATVDVMGGAYPDLMATQSFVTDICAHEEESFRRTLDRGLARLGEILAAGDVSGDDAFFLHDTLGFPVDLTREIAEQRGRTVDADGFAARLKEQSDRARKAHKEAGGAEAAPVELYREVLDEFGPTDFTGREEYLTAGAKVLAVIEGGERRTRASAGDKVDVILDRTPFYAESGGQVGDVGLIEGEGFALRVLDTQAGIPGVLTVHRAEVATGDIIEGAAVTASIDGERRDRIRRNHTATHVLHWALRSVLGEHVQQAGSLVSPERLRFDFSHFQAVTREELDQIEALANGEVITDAPVRHFETTMDEAKDLGAIMFFGDKYGDIVRVLEAGEHSIELCGGTHVHRLGFIGPIKIVGEGSIASGTRRIEAVTGDGALARIHDEEVQLRELADALKASPAEVNDKVARLLEQVKQLNDELTGLRTQQAVAEAATLAAGAVDGVVVARRDGLGPDDLRRLALATRDKLGSGVVAIVGVNAEGTKAGLAIACSKDRVEGGLSAAALAADAARALGGGTAKNAELVVGGGPKVDGVDDALAALRAQVGVGA
ncbi:MAG: alanine--tRNA ligase [Acidimicrobiia bacterium]